MFLNPCSCTCVPAVCPRAHFKCIFSAWLSANYSEPFRFLTRLAYSGRLLPPDLEKTNLSRRGRDVLVLRCVKCQSQYAVPEMHWRREDGWVTGRTRHDRQGNRSFFVRVVYGLCTVTRDPWTLMGNVWSVRVSVDVSVSLSIHLTLISVRWCVCVFECKCQCVTAAGWATVASTPSFPQEANIAPFTIPLLWQTLWLIKAMFHTFTLSLRRVIDRSFRWGLESQNGVFITVPGVVAMSGDPVQFQTAVKDLTLLWSAGLIRLYWPSLTSPSTHHARLPLPLQ